MRTDAIAVSAVQPASKINILRWLGLQPIARKQGWLASYSSKREATCTLAVRIGDRISTDP